MLCENLIVLSFSVCLTLPSASADLVGAYVVPHGGIALSPEHFNTTNSTAKKEAWILHQSYQEIGLQIKHLDPDLLFLSTPHGIADINKFALYLNSAGSGYADTDNCQCPPCCVNVTTDFDYEVAADIVQKLNVYNVSGLSAFGPPGKSDENFPLRWGEVIPLHFVPEKKTIILSQPSRRYTRSVAMIPELLTLGGHLYEYFHKLNKRVVVIISADLAHTHSKDGPYGFSDAAEPFDEACGQWAKTLNKDALLNTAASYVDKALSCGYTGLVMLHGMLSVTGLSSWQPKLYANYHPSYYGMMISSFTR